MRIEPLFDRLLCYQIGKPKPEGTNIITLEEDKNTVFFRVEECGPEVKHLKKGDVVITSQYSAINIELNRQNYKLIQEKQVIGRFHAE